MTLKECYAALQGDYSGAMSRLMQEDRVVKFLKRFMEDTEALPRLEQAVAAQDWDAAFRESHSLKGVCLNLGLDSLGNASAALCDALRGGAPAEDPAPLLAQVQAAYNKTAELVAQL